MEVVDAAWDLLLGAACAGCGAAGRPWCAACGRELAGALRTPPVRARVVPAPPGLPPVRSAAAYDGAVRSAVLAFKERGRRHLARPLGAGLAAALFAVLADGADRGVVAVGVPASATGRRERGYDHVGLLLRAAAARGAPPARPLLRWVRATDDQAGLGSSGRRANLQGALRALPCPGLPVVVVDDVVTTGATLAEAARALHEAGAVVLGAATVATTVRRSARPRGPEVSGTCPGGGLQG